MPSAAPPPAFLLDSSVIVKWFINEHDSYLAQRLREAWALGKVELCYADLSLFEVANALLFSKLFTPSEILEAMQALQALGMEIFALNSQALDASVYLCHDYGIAVYDAYLVALAGQHQYGFITADRRLTKRLTALSFVYDLADYQRFSAMFE